MNLNDLIDLVRSDPIPTSNGGWIEHNGSEICPVAGHLKVEIVFRDGGTAIDTADYWTWDHINDSSDIVKYRIVT